MIRAKRALLGACAVAALAVPAMAETTLTVATVNNGDMIRMQKLAEDFTAGAGNQMDFSLKLVVDQAFGRPISVLFRIGRSADQGDAFGPEKGNQV